MLLTVVASVKLENVDQCVIHFEIILCDLDHRGIYKTCYSTLCKRNIRLQIVMVKFVSSFCTCSHIKYIILPIFLQTEENLDTMPIFIIRNSFIAIFL